MYYFSKSAAPEDFRFLSCSKEKSVLSKGRGALGFKFMQPLRDGSQEAFHFLVV